MPEISDVYYFAHGVENSARPPVILIHGAGGNHLNWPAQVRRLPGERIFAVDLPGHGRSKGLGRQTIHEYAADVLDFMQAVHLRAAVVVGHSMGSAIALSLALDYPGRVLGMGLLGSAAALRVARSIMDLAAAPETFPAAVHRVTEKSYGPGTPARFKELAEERMAEIRPGVLHGDFLACNSFDVTQDLHRIQTPTCILCGQEDRMTPPDLSRALQAGIPHSSLHIFENAGHMLMLEQPEPVAEALGRFLDGLSYQPGV